jgi:O-antigen/teichoic acid export membrane protein
LLLKSSLVKNTAVYGIANAINSAIPFILLPVLSNKIPPEDYGVLAMFLVIVGLIEPFISVGIKGAIQRNYFEKNGGNFPQFVTNAIALLTATTLLFFIPITIFHEWIERYTHFPANWLWIAMLFTYFKVLSEIVLIIWQNQERPKIFGLFLISRTTINLALSLFLVVGISMGWEGRIIGQTSAMFLFGLLSIIILFKNNYISYAINKNILTSILKFGLPLIPHTLGGITIVITDRLFITNMIGVAETGLYFVAFQISQVILVGNDAFNKAWIPWLYKNLKNETSNTKVKIVKITYLYSIAILAVAFLLYLLSPIIYSLFIGAEYISSQPLVIWFVLGFAFNGMYKMVGNYFFYIKKTGWLAVNTVLAGFINIVLNYYLIPIYGLEGAAIASTCSFFLLFIMTFAISNLVYPMPWILRFKSN